MEDIFNDLFERAAELEPCGDARVIASITDGSGRYSYGYGQKKSHPFQKRFGGEDHIYLHAEIDAIKNWVRSYDSDDLTECELYVMRVKHLKRGSKWVTGVSKPCEGCMRGIIHFDIGEVYYTEDNATRFACL